MALSTAALPFHAAAGLPCFRIRAHTRAESHVNPSQNPDLTNDTFLFRTASTSCLKQDGSQYRHQVRFL